MIKDKEYIGKHLFAGHSFDEQGVRFILDDISQQNTKRKKIKIINKTITITRYEKRYCIGRYELLSFKSLPCPHKEELTGKNNICSDCFKFNDFNPAFYNVSFNNVSKKQKEYNDQVHFVYLAYFAPKILKVGIANENRLHIRLCEQGARSALILKRCNDAYEAREIENSISSILGLKEALNLKTKRKLFTLLFDFNNAKRELNELKETINNNQFFSFISDKNEVINLQQYYLGKNKLGTSIIDITENKPLIVSGVVHGVIGDMLIVKQDELYFMCSLKKMNSHIVEINDKIKPYKFKKPQQTSLF